MDVETEGGKIGMTDGCENILHGFLYVFDLAFVILNGFRVLHSPNSFWRSLPEISLLLFFS